MVSKNSFKVLLSTIFTDEAFSLKVVFFSAPSDLLWENLYPCDNSGEAWIWRQGSRMVQPRSVFMFWCCSFVSCVLQMYIMAAGGHVQWIINLNLRQRDTTSWPHILFKLISPSWVLTNEWTIHKTNEPCPSWLPELALIAWQVILEVFLEQIALICLCQKGTPQLYFFQKVPEIIRLWFMPNCANGRN